jgi:hypothetical protein
MRPSSVKGSVGGSVASGASISGLNLASPKFACRVDQKRDDLPYRASGKNVVLEKPTADTSMSATKRFNQESIAISV